MKILVINPGSTSTKIAVYEDEQEIFSKNISHSREEISKFPKISDQLEFRKEIVLEAMEEAGFKISELSAIACRGGNIRPVESGVYSVSEKMVEELLSLKYGAHPSNLAAPIGFEIGREFNKPVFTVDHVVVDEMQKVAKIAGLKGIERHAKDHPLNQKAAAREVAKKLGKKYNECNFIVAHLGGGISVASHRKGRIIDVNNALNGDGPFSPERAGNLPNIDLVEMCFSGNYTKEQLLSMLTGKGGLVSHLGTNSLIEVEKMIQEGNDYAKLVFEAMVYQVAKEIGAHAAVLKGDIDAVVVTGGLAYSEMLVEKLKDYISSIAPVFVVAGEHEMEALAKGVLRALKGEEEVKEYF